MKEKEKVARPARLELATLCLEGRRSIRLSYGRVADTDSKSFIATRSGILRALTLYRKGRRSIQTELQANCTTIVSSCSYSHLFNAPTSTLGPFRPTSHFFDT